MKCPKCNSEWQSSMIVRTCPFCGTAIVKDTCSIVTIADLLSEIFNDYGVQIINETDRFISLCFDYAPNLKREIRLLRSAVNIKIQKQFLAACEMDESEKILILKKASYTLMTELMWNEKYANEFCNAFSHAFHLNEELRDSSSIGNVPIIEKINDPDYKYMIIRLVLCLQEASSVCRLISCLNNISPKLLNSNL